MSNEVVVIKTLEELRAFLNEKGVVEVVTRGKKKKFKQFFDIMIDEIKQEDLKEKAEAALNKLASENNNIVKQNNNLLKGVAGLSKLNLVLSGLNLCATCVGFAIMNKKLEGISGQICSLVQSFEKTQNVQSQFELNNVLSEHMNMLDCRKKQKYYDEDQMRKLVDMECNTLRKMMCTFEAEISSNREELLYAILSLAAMLSASVRFFDELYYFNNSENIGNASKWHDSHPLWVAVFDELSSEKYMSVIQDYALLEKNMSTVVTDYLCASFREQALSLKQDIEDNQKLIEAIGTPELFADCINLTNKEIEEEIIKAMSEASIPKEEYNHALQVTVA